MPELMDNEGVRCRQAAACLLCGREGVVLYSSLRDRWLLVPGIWSVRWCRECELGWLDPRPLSEETSKLYPEGYYTHAVEQAGGWRRRARHWLRDAVLSAWLGYDQLARSFFQRCVGAILGCCRLLRERAELGVMALPAWHRGRVMDVGCGNGQLLSHLRGLGWEVQGLEPDARAARIAQEEFGVPVEVAAIGDVEMQQKFHAITMNHVIEHLDDPLRALEICRSWLEPGGRLVVTTPNLTSVGHWFWRSSWRALDVPRHFFLFTRKSLRSLLERAGYDVKLLRATGRGASSCWQESWGTARMGSGTGAQPQYTIWVRAVSAVVELMEGLWPVREFGGEELVAICGTAECVAPPGEAEKKSGD